MSSRLLDGFILLLLTPRGEDSDYPEDYRRALELDDSLSGAHYGVAFLLKKRGDAEEAAKHLRAFLARPAKGPDADRWVSKAGPEHYAEHLPRLREWVAEFE